METTKYLERQGEPYFPVMGEFHYSRYPSRYWEQELRKMKAGGIEIVATYVIWIHHEEEEGCFDFSGQRDLHQFLALCKKWNLKVFLRLGPWCHGEVRNGGFPDWLLEKGLELRTDDENYLKLVRRFWEKVMEQASPYLAASEEELWDAPVIGIQIENEYGHCGGLRGEPGQQHMRTLTALARQIGYRAAYWTATGWGGAVIGDLTPVMGGYPDAPWDSKTYKLPPNKNYLFTDVRNDGNIGSDFAPGMELSFRKEDYPYLTAELGGGLQVTGHRRPIVSGEDIGAMTLAKLGSGCNLLGYYMYHGGTNPEGKLSTLNECRAAGSYCDVPELSYDFQAPIREYGQISDSFREIKLFAYFLRDFGSDLCKMEPDYAGKSAFLMEPGFRIGAFDHADDLFAVRMIIRKCGRQGYLFINNYQRQYEMASHYNVPLTMSDDGRRMQYPMQDILNKEYFFYPFHFPVGNGEIQWINQTPLCRMGKKVYVFYGDQPLRLAWDGDRKERLLIKCSKRLARDLWLLPEDRNRIYHSPVPVVPGEDGPELWIRSDSRSPYLKKDRIPVWIFRALDQEDAPEQPLVGWEQQVLPDHCQWVGNTGLARAYRKEYPLPVNPTTLLYHRIPGNDQELEYAISIDYHDFEQQDLEDLYLRISYQGYGAALYSNTGIRLADSYFTGEVWEVGLKRFDFPKTLHLKVTPLKSSDDIYLETRLSFEYGVCCKVKSITTVSEQIVPLH